MKWVAKAIVQKTISFLPASQKINYLFQKYVTKGVNLSEQYFEDCLRHATEHIQAYKTHVGNVNGIVTLELGTGWYPVVPISMFLCGADRIITVDIDRLLTTARLRTTLKMFNRFCESTLLSGLPVLPSRLNEFNVLLNENLSLDEMLKRLKIDYIVTDAQHLPIDSDSIDLAHSNNTFEHVYPKVLENILAEMKRIVKISKHGVMSHFIDLSDHFAHFDRSITVYNFLKFSDGQWKWIDNSIQPLNRLRQSDYLKIYEQVNIPVTNVISLAPDKTYFNKTEVNTQFSHYTADDLQVTQSHIVSVM